MGQLKGSLLGLASAAVLVIVSTLIGCTDGATPSALFLFGDSYVDTGNRNVSALSWKPPYGTTWPGRPAGRFSDGRNLGDWIPRSLGFLRQPPPYEFYIQQTGPPASWDFTSKNGLNFAVGGSGVFNSYGYISLGQQVDQLESLLNRSIVTRAQLAGAFVFISTSNNDYSHYTTSGENPLDIPEFVMQVVIELVKQMRRLQAFGAHTIITTNLMPLGCLPIFQPLSLGDECSDLGNSIANMHNHALQSSLSMLRRQNASRFVLADINKAFQSVLSSKQAYDGQAFTDITHACCQSLGNGYLCGETQKNSNRADKGIPSVRAAPEGLFLGLRAPH